jgi:hypothetical protein
MEVNVAKSKFMEEKRHGKCNKSVPVHAASVAEVSEPNSIEYTR